jgi:AraC family transcriptional regulator, ethanolamine operon transcriptional activator
MLIDAGILSPSAISRIGGTTVHSLDDAMRAMRGWQLEIMQMSPGRIDYSLSMLQVGPIQIFREKTDKMLLKRGLSWPGSLVFSLAVNAEGTGWLSGHEVDPQISLMVDGQRLPEILTPRALDLVYIAVDRQWLATRVADRGHGQLADRIRSCSSIALWHDRGARLDRLFTCLFEEGPCVAAAQSEISPDLSLAESLVLDHLIAALTSPHKVESMRDTSNKQLIDRARMLLMENTSEPPTVAEVATHLGISRRHLQTCFNRSVGLSATEFVRAERLNRVRQALCDARREGRLISIGDVAAAWGFWHLSRFAADYRDMFGELPSETLRIADKSLRGPVNLLGTSQNG